ncbi:MAG: fibronectin type III domain-containing protein, partial [Planctomycetes bacterium]|nr:fibronectin type III domain-containing protein [Planctomycetota bacterium]
MAVIADNSIAAAGKEVDHNAGAKSVLRMKGIQHILALKFDLAPIRGWRVQRARLYLHAVREHRLRTIGLSTIASDWQEGMGADKPTDGGSCFTHAVYPSQRWAGEQSDFTDVTFGAGHTLYAFVDLNPQPDGWLEIDVPPKVVAAMLSGASYGLAVSDEKGQTMWNNDVHSREQRPFAPYLVVEGEPSSHAAPPAVAGLQAKPDPSLASLSTGAIQLTFTASTAALAYRVDMHGGESANWIPVPRWRIPFPSKPGEPQSLSMPDLRPNTRYEFRLTVLNEAGSESAAALATSLSSPAKPSPQPLPKLPIVPPSSSSPPSPFFVLPDTVKLDPSTGDILEAADDAAYRQRNPVWDGRTVHLSAARNEIVAFQLIAEAAKVEDIRARDLAGDGGRIAAAQARCYRVWFVREGNRWFPEVALPMQVSGAQNVPNRRFQALWVDIYVPKDARPGEYRGSLVVTMDGKRTEAPLRLRVGQLTLPDTVGFVVDLNGYGSVARHFGVQPSTEEAIAVEQNYHRLAHEHRCTLNLLKYSHSGRVDEGFVPPVQGEGEQVRVGNWRDYDARYGPLLDGSALGKASLRHQYLPFHENYPMPIKPHYRADGITGGYPDLLIRHALEAPRIEQAFSDAYVAGFKAGVREFVRHFAERGWTQTEMQFYLNNKYYYKDPKKGGRGVCWWLLDEPMHRDDWRALAFFGRLFKDALRDAGGVKFVYRCDISRPQWVRDPDEFLPLVDLMCVSGDFFRKNKRCLEYQRRYGTR